MKHITYKITEAFADYWNHSLEALPRLVVAIIILLAFLILGRVVKKILISRLKSRVEDPLLLNFIARVVFIIFLSMGILAFMTQMGWGGVAGGLLASAGVGALVLGFAFKDIGENFIAGFFLAFGRPFNLGDTIEVSGITGRVKQLSSRTTHLRTFDGKDVYIPNGVIIKDKLINFTKDGLLRHDFMLGVAYGTKVDKVIEDILKTIQSNKDIDQDASRRPYVIIKDFGASTVNLGIYYWTNSAVFNGSTLKLKTSIMNTVLETLTNKGYQMPADIIELKMADETPIPVSMKTA